MTRNKQLDIRGDLHSDLDSGILFLLCLAAVCKIALLYYCSLGVSTIIPTIFIARQHTAADARY